MPIDFIQTQQPTGSSSDTLFRLLMKYDGTGRRISKTAMHKVAGAADWDTAQVTHYTGIGTEVRENYAGPAKETKVVVNMPQGLGRYGIENAENPDMGSGVGYIPNTKFEWYLKNHLGSTMLVYGTVASTNPNEADVGEKIAAYDYRAFGEMVELTPPPTDKVTENFTGKEHDDEIALDYFGARYLDPMLGMWTSVDPARQFASPYLYAGNGMNPINVVDPDGNYEIRKNGNQYSYRYSPWQEALFFEYLQQFVPLGSTLLSCLRTDDIIENTHMPDKEISLLSIANSVISFGILLKAIEISKSLNIAYDVTGYFDKAVKFLSYPMSPFFEDYMDNLTLYQEIRGPSLEDLLLKVEWANVYGAELYKNDVEINDDVRHAFGDAYRNQFEVNDE